MAGQKEAPQAARERFEDVVRDAIDELPEFVKAELDRNVAILIRDDGSHPARYRTSTGAIYGLYQGASAAAPGSGARIVIFRDTLMRDFNDPDELRDEIVQTVRHEIAHHLGANERHVEALGL
jgi:predicted Zn-dependent protease with MMP-like domain